MVRDGLRDRHNTGRVRAPDLWLPHQDPTWDPKVSWLSDDAFRGSPVDTYDEVQGVRYDEIGFKTNVYADAITYLLVAALGGSDVVTPTPTPTPTSYKHTVGLFNTPSRGSEPPTLSLVWFDGENATKFTGCKLDSMNITFVADGRAEAAIKWICNIGAPYTTPTPPVFTTEPWSPAGTTPSKYATTSQANIISGEIDFKREAKSISPAVARARSRTSTARTASPANSRSCSPRQTTP